MKNQTLDISWKFPVSISLTGQSLYQVYMTLYFRSIQLNWLYPDSCGQVDCDQSELITLVGYNCLFKTLIFNSTCETITQKHLLSSMSISNCVLILIFALAIQEFQIGGEGRGSVLKKINYTFYKHFCWLQLKYMHIMQPTFTKTS